MSETRNERTRITVAQLAARLMAEDGEIDIGRARRKAAHTLGAKKIKELPDNREVEAALRAHQALFMADTHSHDLLCLKKAARQWMHAFTDFSPRLTGAIVKGTALFSSPIEIDLLVDDIKSFDFFLLNHNFEFQIVFAARDSSQFIYRLKNEIPSIELRVNTAVTSRTQKTRQDDWSEFLSLAELEKQLNSS